MGIFNKYWRSIPTTRGLVLFALLTGFFLLMRALNLAHIFELRALNVFFVFFVLRSTIYTFQQRADASYYDDFIDFFKVAMWTSLLGIVLFAFFVMIYLDQLDPEFMGLLQEYENAGGYITPVTAGFAIILEGMASAIICAFIIIQWKKKRTVEKPMDSPSSLEKESKR